METYGFLRTLADSWGMLAMLLIFAGVVLWVFRPGSRKKSDEAAGSIFRNEDKPKDDTNGH